MLVAFPAWAQDLSESTDLAESDMEMNDNEVSETSHQMMDDADTEVEEEEEGRLWRWRKVRHYYVRRWCRTYVRPYVWCRRVYPRRRLAEDTESDNEVELDFDDNSEEEEHRRRIRYAYRCRSSLRKYKVCPQRLSWRIKTYR